MTKNFIQLFMFAATMLTATALTGCGEEVIDNGGENAAEKNPTAQAVFSCGDDDLTRTSINNKRAFFWEKGDKIWVNDGSEWNKSTKSDIAAPNTPTAKFVLPGSYTEEEYQLLYTGYANGDTATTQYNKVIVADVQTQKAWNDGSHLGTSGDCGTARAYKQGNGSYRFTLNHKASYLLFYPYLHTDLTGDYTLEKIEVYSDLSASNIAGTFDFTYDDGLADHPDASTGKQEITLNCGNVAGTGFGLLKTAPVLSDVNNAAPHCFMVIAPGTHQLTIRYYAKKDGVEYDFIKDIALKEYQPNGVYTFVHELHYAEVDYGLIFNEDNLYYKWGATTQGESGTALPSDYITDINLPGTFWQTIPNFNEASWYMEVSVADRPYWDNSVKWTYNRSDGTTETRRGGIWLKRRKYITGFSNSVLANRTARVPIKGRPDASVINQYFFLPAFGGVSSFTNYWIKTPLTTEGSTSTGWAYDFIMSSSEVKHYDYRAKGTLRVAGYRPNTGNTPGYDEQYKNYWFQ